MEEDYLLIEAAKWANYYDQVNKAVQEISNAKIAERPPQNVIDQPELFRGWLQQCEEMARRG